MGINESEMKVNSVNEYIEKLQLVQVRSKNRYLENCIFYRGQNNIEFDLKPSVYRKNVKDKEDKVYLKVLTECSNEFDTNMTHIDIISKMQHYGVPTRLLDVTTNALVALYFACDNVDKDGCVFIFNPCEKDIKKFDSDTISILSSLPRFNSKDKANLLKYAQEYSQNIEDFNKKDVVKRLLHEVKREKPAFENIINPQHLLANYFLLPKKNNPRIIRQSGAFIIYGLHDEKIKVIDKIIIAKESKNAILKQLKYFGISKASLYPELYKVSEYIKDCIRDNVDF